MPSEERPARVWLDQLREFVEHMDPRASHARAEIRAQMEAAQQRVMAESALTTGSLAAEHIQRAREAMRNFQDPYRHTPGASYWINELNQQRNQRIDSQGLAAVPSFTPSPPRVITTDRTVLEPSLFEACYRDLMVSGTSVVETRPNEIISSERKRKECSLFIARQTFYTTSVETVLTHIRDACKSRKINLNREYTFKTKPSLDMFKVKVTIRQLTGAPRWLTGDDLIRQWVLQQSHTGTTMALGANGPEFLYPGEEQ